MKLQQAEKTQVYDAIGRGYLVTRQPDPRIADMIHSALGTAQTVPSVDNCATFGIVSRDTLLKYPQETQKVGLLCNAKQ